MPRIVAALLPLALLPLALIAPPPPQITVAGCVAARAVAQVCALISGADDVTADPAPAAVEAIAGARLLIWPAPPAWIAASGSGGEARWERGAAPPPPTPTPAPLGIRQWLPDVWR